jgi:uncharacterized protein YcfJ
MMLKSLGLLSVGALCLAVGGCASTGPAQPSVSVLPGKGKPYATFQREDAACQGSAQAAIGNQSPGQAANDAAVSSAAVGTGLGALAGAAIGSMSGNVGAGAAIGAGTGLVAGGVVGSNRANEAGGSLQARYDNVYAQCMAASGNVIAAPPPPPVVVYEREPVYVDPYYGRPRYYRRW